MITTALIDIDGVINHATRFSTRYAEKYGLSPDVLTPFFTGPFQDCLVGKADLRAVLPAYFAAWGWHGTVDELLEFWLAGEVNPDAAVVAAIHTLHTGGTRVVGASNQEQYRMAYLRRALQLDDYFAHLYSSAGVGYAKPDPHFYQYIMTDLHLLPNEIAYWDDDQENVAAAQTLGITSYLFTNKEDFLTQASQSFPKVSQ